MESGSRLTEVAPLLHRILIALGSFPYQNEPLEHLTIEVLSVALGMIRCKQDGQRYLVDSPYDEGMQQSWLDSVHRRLLFQSIANHNSPSAISEKNLQRTNEDDEDLLQVVAYLSQHNYFEVLGSLKEVMKGPELPEVSYLPTSRSKMLGIPVPSVELGILIRFLLTTQLCASGTHPEHFKDCSVEADVVSRHILNAFAGIHNSQATNSVDWTTFNHMIENHLVSFISPCRPLNTTNNKQPNLFAGLRWLLRFPKANAAWLQKLKDETSGLRAVPTTGTQSVFTKGTLLTLPLLAQMVTFLPANFAWLQPSVVFSENSRTVNLGLLESIIIEQKKPLLVLFSAKKSEIRFGAFFARRRPTYVNSKALNGEIHLETDMIFQYAPVHQVFRAVQTPYYPPISFESVVANSIMTEDIVASSLTFTVASGDSDDRHATITLVKGGESQLIYFDRPFPNMTGQLKRHMKDELAFGGVELVTFDRRTRAFDS